MEPGNFRGWARGDLVLLRHVGIQLGFLGRLVSHDSVDRRYTRYVFPGTHGLGEEPVPDFPGKHGRVGAFVLADFFDHVGGGHFGFRPADHARPDAPGFVISESIG